MAETDQSPVSTTLDTLPPLPATIRLDGLLERVAELEERVDRLERGKKWRA